MAIRSALMTYASAVCIALSSVLSAQTLQARETLLIATADASPPFRMENDAGELTGFDVDLAYALCQQMQVSCTVVNQSPNDLIAGLQAHDFDAVIGSPTHELSPQDSISFSHHYYSSALRFVSPRTVDVKAIQRIGVRSHSAAAKHLRDGRLRLDNFKLKHFATQTALWRALKQGDIDMVFTEQWVAYSWLQEQGHQSYGFFGYPVAEDSKVGIALRKDDNELRSRFNQALHTILRNGVYRTINRQYFPFSIY